MAQMPFDDESLDTPVVSLKEAFPLQDFITNHETEFEIRPDEDEEDDDETVPESCLNFNDIKSVINLDMLEVDIEDGDDGTPFDRYRRKMTNVREDGKVKKFVVRPGQGPIVPNSSVVFVRYQAYLEYQEVPFDSTLWQCGGEDDRPMPFNLAKGQVILGLHEAFLTMQKGEKAEILVEPELAYGKMGCPPRVPPDSTILFIVEVIKYIEYDETCDNNENKDPYELRAFKEVKKTLVIKIEEAREAFKNEKYKEAKKLYETIVKCLHNSRLADEADEIERNHWLIKYYTNACVCCYKLKNYKRICCMAADATRVDEKKAFGNAKLQYYWGSAKMMLGDYKAALDHLLRAKKLNSTDQQISRALSELHQKQERAAQQERFMMRRAFGFTPSTSDVKISEVNEAEEKLRETVKEELNKFGNSSDKEWVLPEELDLSREEENIYLQEAETLGLYARPVEGEGAKRIVVIKKPDHF